MPSMLFNQLITKFRAFRADEDGAVTVDFVVLTSFVVMMGLGHVKDIADELRGEPASRWRGLF